MLTRSSSLNENRNINILLASASIIVIGVWPLLMSLLSERLQLNISQQGRVISAESIGMVLGTLASIWLSRSGNIKRTLIISLAVGVLMNILTAQVSGLTPLLLCRFIVGVSAGVCYSLSIFQLGRMPGADRSFSLSLALQTILFSLYAVVFPLIAERFGYSIAINTLTAWFVVMLLASIFLKKVTFKPENKNTRPAEISNDSSFNASLAGLVGMTFLQVAVYSVWGYIANIGQGNQLSDVQIGTAFGIGLIGGLPGALLTGFLIPRVGRVALSVCGSLLVLFSVLSFYFFKLTAIHFTLCILILNFGWMLALSAYMAMVAHEDKSGKLTRLIGFVQIGGATLAPVLIAFIATGNGLTIIYAISCAGAIAAAVVPLLTLPGRVRKNIIEEL